MKKFTIVMASAMIALGASAAPEKVWEGTYDYGNWAEPTTITSPKFASAKAGDIITMVYDDVQSGAQYQVAFFDTGDKWTVAVEYADIAGTIATYTLTGKAVDGSAETDVQMLATRGFATKGQKAVLKAVYFGDEYEPEKPAGTEVVWEGTAELGSWNNDIAIGDKDNAFAKLFKGDKIIFNFSQADADAQIQINTKVGSDWTWTTMVDADPITDKKYVFTKDTTQTAPTGTTYIDINNAVSGLATALTNDGHSVTTNGDTVTITAAAKTDGSLWTWGMNWNGELGNGGKGNVIEDAERRTIHQTVPVKVMDGVAAVSCGNSYTAAIKADGSLWTCGSNSSGQLGNGNKGNFYSTTWPDNPSQDVFGKVMDNIKVPQNTGAVTPAPSVKTAQPTSDALTANGVLQNPTVYNIDGNNYFKIRDLAAILNGTEKQFSVGYDATLKSVTVTTGQSYDKLPTDLTGAPTGGSKTAVVSTDTIYIDGKKVDAQVYMIGGNNYFKLRDLGKALDFYVGWSQGRGVFIETDKPYQD